jgi:3-carboxy-cis,cis-muconate cycloisomerase
MFALADLAASTPAMRATFDAPATIRALLRTESALSAAGAACGLLPPESATAIQQSCESESPDPETLAADAQLAGTAIIPLVKWLRLAVGQDHARHVHIGGTSQDIIDTGLILQLRDGISLLDSDLAAMANAAATLAARYAETPMTGRTLLQSALPITFGLKAAYWLTAINDSRTALTHAAAEALTLSCGGATGTLDAIPTDKVEPFLTAFGAALSLAVPTLPWHTRRAPLLRLAAALTGAVGVAGKIGTDIALLAAPEIAEISEPAAPGRGGSSAMAHKRNPTLSIACKAAATRMTGFLATLAAAQMPEHERAAGAWQAEAAVWPAAMLCASGALAAAAELLSGLEIHEAAMEAHLLDNAPPGAASQLIARALNAHKKGNS